MMDMMLEYSEADREQIGVISDCLKASAEYAARALQLTATHRLFGRSSHLREASREATAAKSACDRALQLLAGACGPVDVPQGG